MGTVGFFGRSDGHSKKGLDNSSSIGHATGVGSGSVWFAIEDVIELLVSISRMLKKIFG
jgi:hypothetical protein